MDLQEWKRYFPEFRKTTAQFYEGSCSQSDYKKISGFFGSYAQRGGQANMLRLRMTAGRVTKEKMAFTAKMLKKHQITKLHFTTCQTIQLHDLQPEVVYEIMEQALDAGIITIGGGGDYPRNVMCPPLSGVEKDEYFNVLPWAEAAGEYLMKFITAEKMPRKLKVGFSSSVSNITHATYRDLGFAATKEGKFDVYSAGGLGVNPRFGVKVAESIEPETVLYYIKAMWLMFLAYGNYENRVKARTRYMQEALGGPEKYAAAYQEKLKEVFAADEDLYIYVSEQPITKKGKIGQALGHRIREQRQEGLYTVIWHPLGGVPDAGIFCALNDAIAGMESVELRLSPDETAYIINLTAEEAQLIAEITKDSATSIFETSVSCIGSSVCQVGIRDSQRLLAACIQAVRAAEIPDGALPQIHISGCPSSCGTHQTGRIGFRGGVKKINGKPQPAFILSVDGHEYQGEEAMGRELGAILEAQIPDFLVLIGKTVSKSKLSFDAWYNKNPEKFDQIAAEFIN